MPGEEPYDRRNPHNAYKHHPSYNASPIYIPPSKSTQRILPVPQEAGQGDYHYGRPGEARPIYIPNAADAKKKRMVKSDERSKKEIERLQSTNDALTKALDQAHASTPEGNMPPTEYPKLPSRTNYADTPAANRVAAQNVGIQAATQPPPAAPPPMTQLAPPPPPTASFPPPGAPSASARKPGFDVGAGMPDLSALDEAYRRQGMGG